MCRYGQQSVSTFVLEFDMFSMLPCWKMISIYFRKIAGKLLILSKNAGKAFAESCNNPVLNKYAMYF